MRQQRGHLVRWLAGVALAAGIVCSVASVASAHEEGISSADPEPGSKIDQPISQVTLEFPSEISDVRLGLLDPDENPIESVATIVSPTVARIDFPLLDRKGLYIVRYDATVAADGHLLTGAMSFKYGSTGGGMSATTWIVLMVLSAAILAVGVKVSLRNQRQMQASTNAKSVRR